MKRDFAWLNLSAKEAAQRLLGCELVRIEGDSALRVRIVETEAYDQHDAASHAFRGKTARNEAMFLGAGHLYVYFTYGMHHCCNVVCGAEGFGSGVLIRAVEPIGGVEIMEQRRGVHGVGATNGPGKVCAALAIDRRFSGHHLSEEPIRLVKRAALPREEIVCTPRVGISRAVDVVARYYIRGNRYVSKGPRGKLG